MHYEHVHISLSLAPPMCHSGCFFLKHFFCTLSAHLYFLVLLIFFELHVYTVVICLNTHVFFSSLYMYIYSLDICHLCAICCNHYKYKSLFIGYLYMLLKRINLGLIVNLDLLEIVSKLSRLLLMCSTVFLLFCV